MSDFESDRLKSEIDELVPGMVALRRDLHEHPELAFEEIRTSRACPKSLLRPNYIVELLEP